VEVGIVSRRDEFARMSDDELEVQSVLLSAESALMYGEELYRGGFRLREVVGSDALLWERDGRLYTRESALTEVGIIPEQKEDRS
jgi:hypothetical protein